MRSTTSFTLPVLVSLAAACAPGAEVVLARNADAGTDVVSMSDVAPTPDVSPTPDVGPTPDVAPTPDMPPADVEPAGTDEVWTTRSVTAPLGCSVGQWCWEHPIPQGEAVFDSWAFSATDVWVVGAYGLAMRWNGTVWQRTATNTNAEIRRVWASGPNDIWAITASYTDTLGSRQTLGLIRWNGTRWSPVTLPVGVRPSHVSGSGVRDVWLLSQPEAAGSSSAWRYDGTQWTEVRTGLPERGLAMRELWVERAGRVWMYAGEPGAAHAYVMYRYEGSTWRLVEDIRDSVEGHAFSGRIAGANGEVYVTAVGLGGLSTWYFVQASQSPMRFERPPAGARSYGDNFIASGGTLWSVGTTTFRRDGGTWTRLTLPRPNDRVREPTSLAAADGRTAWAFNVYADMYRMTEGTWSLYTSEDKPAFTGLAARNGTPMAYGSSVYARAPSATWSRTLPMVSNVSKLVLDPSGTPRWAISNGRCLRLEATPVDATPTGAMVSAMWMPDMNTTWMVTGNRLARWNGTLWVDAPALPARIGTVEGARVELLHVWANGRDVWVAGGQRRVELENDYNGVLCRLRDNAWMCVDLATIPFEPTPVEGLWGSSASGLWMLLSGSLVRVNTETLARTSVGLSTGRERFSGLTGNDANGDLGVLGHNSMVVFHPVMRTAERITTPVSGYAGGLGSVLVANDGGLWAAGGLGQILRYRAR